jgi:pimeloyl-ACP methyl ester carboxylesterase
MFLIDDLAYLPLARAVARQMQETARVVIVASAPVNAGSWKSLSESLSLFIEQLGVRQAGFVGMGAGATLVQNLALSRPKLVRTLVCIDASSRPHPTRWERVVDRLEENLPFGLPLRLGSDGFNIKSYVHRLRAPLLVVGTNRASAFVIREMESLSRLAPTAWNVMICESDREQEAAALTETLFAFYDTPAKCPQKNLGAAA